MARWLLRVFSDISYIALNSMVTDPVGYYDASLCSAGSPEMIWLQMGWLQWMNKAGAGSADGMLMDACLRCCCALM